MRLGVLESWWDGEPVVPGHDAKEVATAAVDAGFDGLQVGGRWEDRHAAATEIAGSGLALLEWGRDPSLIGETAGERARGLDDLIRGLHEAAELGAEQSVVIPTRRSAEQLGIPAFGSGRDSAEAVASERLVDALLRAARTAEALGVTIVIEALNRYESALFHTVGSVAAVSRAVGSPNVKIMADLFHMSIEEVDLVAAIHSVGDVLGHVQLADSNRFEPGAGRLDIDPVLRELAAQGFDGWVSLECKVTDATSLATLVERVRAAWASGDPTELPAERVVHQG